MSIFKQKKYLKSTKLYRAQSGRGLRRRAGPKKGVAVDSGTPFSLPMTNPVLSCLVLSSGLSFGVPADRSKTVLFMPEKWAWPENCRFSPIFVTRFLAFRCPESGRGLPRGRGGMPHPLPRPPGVLGWRFTSFSCRKIAVFADFRHSFFGCLVPRKWAWPSEGGVADAPPPVGLLGGLCPVRFTGF